MRHIFFYFLFDSIIIFMIGIRSLTIVNFETLFFFFIFISFRRKSSFSSCIHFTEKKMKIVKINKKFSISSLISMNSYEFDIDSFIFVSDECIITDEG